MDKISKLNSLLALLKDQTITPTEVERLLGILISALKTNNDSFKTLSAENIQTLKNYLSYVQVEHAQVISQIDEKNNKLEGTFKQKLQEATDLLNQIKEIKVTPGKDGVSPKPEDIVPLVLEQIKLPTSEKFVLDGKGEQIVTEINDLPTDDDELKIDAGHIKNLPKEVQKHTFAVQRNLAWYDETTLIIENPTKIKFQGSGVQASVDNEGSVIVTVNGGSGSATFEDEAMVDSGNHTAFTISFSPTAGTLLVINENTGQAVPTGAYTNTTTSVTFSSIQQIDDGAGNLVTPTFRARYSH